MAKKRMNRTMDTTTRVFTFNIDDGKAVVTFDLAKLSPAMIDFYVGRGINQLDGDAVAGDTGPETTAESIAAILTARRDSVYAGIIPSGRGAAIPRGGLSADDYGDLIAAVATVKKMDVTDAESTFQAKMESIKSGNPDDDKGEKKTRKEQREYAAKLAANASVKKLTTVAAAKRATDLAKAVSKAGDSNEPLEL